MDPLSFAGLNVSESDFIDAATARHDRADLDRVARRNKEQQDIPVFTQEELARRRGRIGATPSVSSKSAVSLSTGAGKPKKTSARKSQ